MKHLPASTTQEAAKGVVAIERQAATTAIDARQDPRPRQLEPRLAVLSRGAKEGSINFSVSTLNASPVGKIVKRFTGVNLDSLLTGLSMVAMWAPWRTVRKFAQLVVIGAGHAVLGRGGRATGESLGTENQNATDGTEDGKTADLAE